MITRCVGGVGGGQSVGGRQFDLYRSNCYLYDRQGQGIFLYSNGNIFEGEWEGDKVGRQRSLTLMILMIGKL